MYVTPPSIGQPRKTVVSNIKETFPWSVTKHADQWYVDNYYTAKWLERGARHSQMLKLNEWSMYIKDWCLQLIRIPSAWALMLH